MKKLKLKDLNIGTDEVLSREELKKVLGGLGSGGGSGNNTCYHGCNCGEGWPEYGTWTNIGCSTDSDCSVDFTCDDGCKPYTKCG